MGCFNIEHRLKIVFAEYVLTHYYLKKYPSRQQREQVARDLADYYAMVAFRAVAEQGYTKRHLLSNGEICALADYTATRMHNYIMTAFLDPEGFNRIRKEEKKFLDRICWDNLDEIRTPKPWIRLGTTFSHWSADTKRRDKWRRECAERKRKIVENQERCVND
jgi:hypothetical protein